MSSYADYITDDVADDITDDVAGDIIDDVEPQAYRTCHSKTLKNTKR